MAERFISEPEIRKRTGRSHVTLWRWWRAGLFPRPYKIGPNSTAWAESEIEAWERSRPVVTAKSESVKKTGEAKAVYAVLATGADNGE